MALYDDASAAMQPSTMVNACFSNGMHKPCPRTPPAVTVP
ncbi:hypothetical protein EIO_0586 [Ketogulonicigenium vulgare Y25]|nr:hypothetical protein EIO_0586 [Ketogulonicigenium vulgare Y25]AOZ53679.1 hypothetical protein KVC_0655 [Ketogulonicigenium vulgare]